MKTTAILIPTYKRYWDLINTLENTMVDDNAKFIIVANLEDEELAFIENKYGDRSIIVDERPYGKMGGCKAYNLAFKTAKENKFDYAILFADDIIPFEKNWVKTLTRTFINRGGKFGVFSSDEGHPRIYGYNFIVDCPIAHFFVIDCSLCDQLFPEEYKQYVIDFEIAVRLQEQGIDIMLLPIKLNHLRSGLHREFFETHYTEDAKTFLETHPKYKQAFEDQSESYLIPHANKVQYISGIDVKKLQLWADLKYKERFLSKVERKIKSKAASLIRRHD